MNTTPDPKTVREIAREAIRSASQRLELIDAVIARHRAIGDRPASESGELGAWHATYSALCQAVRADMQAASWPDEQPQDERDVEISRLRRLLGIGVDRDQWDAIAEAEGARFEYEQTDDNLVGYLAYRYEDIKAQRHILLREIEDAKAAQDHRGDDATDCPACSAARHRTQRDGDATRLAQIRDRSQRLAEIPFDHHDDANHIVTDLIDSAADVKWLLKQLHQTRTDTAPRQPEDGGDPR